MDARPSHLDTGRIGEEAAVARYLSLGYRVVARNWRCRFGEIDVVLLGRGALVFCEVKCRRGNAYGRPFEAVHPRKQRKLRTLAEAFLATTAVEAEGVRFDVASVTIDGRGRTRLNVFEDAF